MGRKIKNKDRKDDILQAAIKVFGEKGYNASTTREIAEEAGVSNGTMFRHFHSKEDILYALPVEIVKNVFQKLLVESMEAIFTEYIGKNPKETLKAFINSRIKIINNNSDIFKVVLTESLYNDELREIVVQEIFYPMKKLAENFIKNGMDNGYFREVDPETAASFFAGALIFMNLEYQYLKKRDVEQMEDVFINLVFYGLSAEKES